MCCFAVLCTHSHNIIILVISPSIWLLLIVFTMSCAGSRYMFDSETGDLTIDTVTVTDTANYRCTATNLVGVATAVVEVLVRGELQ